LGSTLHQLRYRLPDGGKRLIEVGGDVCDILASWGGWRATRGPPSLIDTFERLGDLGLRHVEGRLFLLEFLDAHRVCLDQSFRPFKLRRGQDLVVFDLLPIRRARPDHRDLVVDLLDGVFQFETKPRTCPIWPRTVAFATTRSAWAASTAACLMATWHGRARGPVRPTCPPS